MTVSLCNDQWYICHNTCQVCRHTVRWYKMMSRRCHYTLRFIFTLLSVLIVYRVIVHQPVSHDEGYCPDVPPHYLQKRPLLNISNYDVRATVAVVLALTTRHLSPAYTPTLEHLPLFHSMLTSFCATCSQGYYYPFFVAYDYNDTCMLDYNFFEGIKNVFLNYTSHHCPKQSKYTIEFLRCNHTRHVAWAQNDAMMVAYNSGADYMYRINDDTIFETPNWTEIFIEKLKNFTPPNVGIVGPNHKQGNLKCLTYEFVHRTHIDILGFHYPRYFMDWDADVWITALYQPGRVIKVKDVSLLHTMQYGVRYKAHRLLPDDLKELVNSYREVVSRYVGTIEAASLLH